MENKGLRSVVLAFAVVGATLVTPLSAQAQPAAAQPKPTQAQPAAAQPKPTTAPAPGAPSAEGTDAKIAEAKSRYKSGLALYDDGAFEAARVQFERAYELAPSYKILYNVGLVYKQLNEFVAALKAFQKYLAEGGAEVPADRRAEVTKLIDGLLLIVASATVTANYPDAEIAVDDAVVGKAPLSAPVLLNPGRRKISAKLPGKLPDAKVITVAGGDKATVDLVLTEAIVINQGTDVKPIIAWSVTGALAIGAGVTGFLANGASNDRSDLLNKKDVSKSDLDAALSKQNTLSLVSDILSITTVVSLGVSVWLTWFNKPSKAELGPEKTTEPEKKAAGVRVTPGLGSMLVQF